MAADLFLREWQDVAKLYGVGTYRKVPTMRDAAIEFVVSEFVPAAITINRDAVLDYMTKRGKLRRN